MSDSLTSVRHVLSQPEAGAPKQPGDQWQQLHHRLSEEVKGIKVVALPDLIAKVSELLDIEIPDLLLTSWKKCNQLQTALEESRKSPEKKMYVGLAEHSISSKHYPYIEARIARMPAKQIKFTLQLLFKLTAFELEIQGGAIKRAKTGSCAVEGSFAYDKLVLLQKKLTPISLPGSIALGGSQSASQGTTAPR